MRKPYHVSVKMVRGGGTARRNGDANELSVEITVDAECAYDAMEKVRMDDMVPFLDEGYWIHEMTVWEI